MKLLRLAWLVAGAMLVLDVAAQAKTNQTVAVKVQDVSGKPISGATVEFYNFGEGGFDLRPTAEKPKSEMTDSDGMAKTTVNGPWGQVLARKTGMAIAGSYCAPSMSQPIVLTLDQAVSVSGTVLDASNNPVPDAKVFASTICFIREDRRSFSYLTTDFNEDLLSARTGTDGRFRIEGVPTNSALDLVVKKSGLANVFPERNGTSPDTMTARAGQQDIKLKTQPAGSIEGKLQIPAEAKNLPIYLNLNNEAPSSRGGRPPWTQPAADGSFRFGDLAEGSYQIVTTFGTNKVPEWVAPRQFVSVEAGKVKRDINIAVIKGGVLEVATFSTVGHKPLAGVTVYAIGQDAPSLGQNSGLTGDNGLFSMRLCPGQYRVSGNLEGSQAKEETLQIVEGKTNRVELELPPPPQLSGTVRDTNGAPLVGIEVKVYPNWGIESNVKTDTNGHFEMKFMLLGGMSQGTKPFVMVRDRDRNLAAARDIEEGTETYDLQLAPALVASGRVLDEQGKPLTNAAVNIVAWGGNTGWWIDNDKPPKIDAQGRYEFGALPVARRYCVNVTANGYGSAYTKNEEPDTTRFEFETVTLRVADKKIAGVVVDSENNPVKGASISIYGDGQPNTSKNTDDQGRFAIDGVCDGIVRISASISAGGSSSYGNAQAEAGDTNIVVTLGRQSGSTRVQARRASLVGNPLPDLTLAGISAEAIQTNKPLLICLFDPEQRPSRRVLRLLGEQNDALQQKGVTVVGISAALMTADALKEWKQSNPQPFPVGAVIEKTDKSKWILSTEKFPWLILSDDQGRVKAEGFDGCDSNRRPISLKNCANLALVLFGTVYTVPGS